MPWKIEKRDGLFCVVKADGGKQVACHPSREAALAQLKALYANVADEIANAVTVESLTAVLTDAIKSDSRFLPMSVVGSGAVPPPGRVVEVLIPTEGEEDFGFIALLGDGTYRKAGFAIGEDGTVTVATGEVETVTPGTGYSLTAAPAKEAAKMAAGIPGESEEGEEMEEGEETEGEEAEAGEEELEEEEEEGQENAEEAGQEGEAEGVAGKPLPEGEERQEGAFPAKGGPSSKRPGFPPKKKRQFPTTQAGNVEMRLMDLDAAEGYFYAYCLGVLAPMAGASDPAAFCSALHKQALGVSDSAQTATNEEIEPDAEVEAFVAAMGGADVMAVMASAMLPNADLPEFNAGGDPDPCVQFLTRINVEPGAAKRMCEGMRRYGLVNEDKLAQMPDGCVEFLMKALPGLAESKAAELCDGLRQYGANEGTSEGAKKGWETRKGGAKRPEEPSERDIASARRQDEAYRKQGDRSEEAAILREKAKKSKSEKDIAEAEKVADDVIAWAEKKGYKAMADGWREEKAAISALRSSKPKAPAKPTTWEDTQKSAGAKTDSANLRSKTIADNPNRFGPGEHDEIAKEHADAAATWQKTREERIASGKGIKGDAVDKSFAKRSKFHADMQKSHEGHAKRLNTMWGKLEREGVADESDPDVIDDTFIVLANEFSGTEAGAFQWVQLSPYGEFSHSVGMQRFTREDASNVVASWKGLGNVAVRMIGMPWYIGHPDHDAFKDRYTDTRAFGRIKDIEARDDGLYGKVKWNKLGMEAIENEEFHGHSVNWGVRLDQQGKLRPWILKSVGFTNEPNIPVQPIIGAVA